MYKRQDNDGTIAPAALDWIKRFGSYAEISPSGTGVHVLIKAKLSGSGRRTGKVEMYDSGRYFTITGTRVPETPLAILNRQDVLDQFSAETLAIAPSMPSVIYITDQVALSDDELIERAANARNGDRFKRLWAGEISDYENDHSRADLALCGMLAFWCGGDTERIDRLFRRSGLMREKWDRRTGESAYGFLTIGTVSHK